MSETKTLNFPELSTREHAEELLSLLKTACPHPTFLSREPGCEAVGQDTPLARAIEAAMKEHFDRWADTWMRPHIEDIIASH